MSSFAEGPRRRRRGSLRHFGRRAAAGPVDPAGWLMTSQVVDLLLLLDVDGTVVRSGGRLEGLVVGTDLVAKDGTALHAPGAAQDLQAADLQFDRESLIALHAALLAVRQDGEATALTLVVTDTAGFVRHLDARLSPAGDSAADDRPGRGSFSGGGGQPGFLLLSAWDVTDRACLTEQLAQQAFRDSLTGLANRVLFREQVDAALARLIRQRAAPIVLFCDLDEFKLVNDTYGHAVGDALLKDVAADLQRVLREGDVAARLGGDEFAVLLEDGTQEEAARGIADRITERVARMRTVHGRQLRVGVSVGVALGLPGESTEELLRNADIAMYEAKSRPHEQVTVFQRPMHASVVRHQQLRVDLERAIDGDELLVEYQPVVDLRTGEVHAWEALVRWEHPTLGVVAPDEFVPIAEETGVIVRLGRWVLHAASSQLVAWRRDHPDVAGHHRMHVNVSAAQLSRPGFADDVLAILGSVDLPPSGLVVELPELALLEGDAAIGQALGSLRRAGVGVAVDDFGRGYASMQHLRSYPVDLVKIDRSFTTSVGEGGEGRRVADAITVLANTIGVQVAASGIEDDEQRDALLAIGCPRAQGYRFARPMSASAVQRSFGRHATAAALAQAVLAGDVDPSTPDARRLEGR